MIARPVGEWKGILVNDFEPAIYSAYPDIEKIKTALYHAGAVYASLSGSGASVYGIFNKEQVRALDFPPHYFVKEC